MHKHLRFILFFLLAMFCAQRPAAAQTAFASEDELKQQATKLFDDDQFEEAYPLYSQLVSLYPKDLNYNYRLGVCMLYASDDKEKPIPFLEYAAKKPEVDKEVLFYLAKAYHLNYRFDDAITEYMEYQKVASSAKAEKLQVTRQIEMCRNGKKLLRNITDLVVIDKKELSRADFYRAYDISDIGGKLLAKPDEDAFKTSLDKKKKEKSIIYLASNNNQVYFSSYGDDPSHGKDIYVIRKLPNGEWSKPQTLGYPVNTEYDEDYPFLHPNGKVLYFCSKGHNSMGGYDIFKTTLNEETNTWNKPVNLDFPINTPDDDILYVTNEDEKEAFFSSARNSKTGKTAVFHINVERKPIDIAIIKGAVMRNRDGQALDVKITVKDLADNMILGIYNSKAENGVYLINLPNGGKFLYTVEAAGFPTQSEVVVLPTQYEFKPLKQEISYELGTDKLIVKNMFDEPVDDQSYLQVLSVIKEKARMDAGITNDNPVAVNKTAASDDNSTPAAPANSNAVQVSDYGTRTVEHQGAGDAVNPDNTGRDGNNPAKPNTAKAPTTTAKTNNPPAQLSNNDIVKIAYDDAKDAEKEAKDLQEQADIALNLANQKNELAQNKKQEADQLMTDANQMSDQQKKQTALDEANQARSEEDELNQETVAAFNIAKKLSMKASAKAEEADLSLQYAKDLEAAVKSKNSTEAMAKLEEQEKKLEALSEQNGTAEPDNITAGLKMDADAKKRELDKATQASADIRQEIQDNLTLIGNLQSDLEKTKKEDLKKGIEDQIAGLKADNEQSQKDLDLNDQKVAKLQKDYNGIQNEMALVSSVVDKSRSGTGEEAAASVKAIDRSKLEAQVNEMKSNTTVAPSLQNGTNAGGNTALAGNNTNRITDAGSVGNSGDAATPGTTGSAVSDAGATNSTDAAATNTAAPADYAAQYADQLAAADNIPNAADRENKKAQLYQSWTATISNDLARTKQAAKSEKNADKKKALNASVAVLEKELKDKQQLQSAAVANAKKLEQEQAVAATNPTPGTTTTPDNSTAATTPNTASTNALSIDAVNANYSSQLADANKISNDLERENAKADVLKNWADAINSVIAKQKSEMASTTDPGLKASLAKQISDAQQLSDEKQTQATASLAQADALKQQQALASNGGATPGSTTTSEDAGTNAGTTAPENTGTTTSEPATTAGTAASIATQQLDAALAEADKTSSEQEKANKKKDAYAAYIATQNDELKSKQTALKAEKNKDKKKALANEIASIQSDIQQKQQLLDDATAKAKSLESAAVAAGGSASGEENTNEAGSATAAAPLVTYSNAEANTSAQQAKADLDAAAALDTRAEDLKAKSAAANKASDKQALNAQALEAEQQADAKRTEAMQLSSNANTTQYKDNQYAAEQYAAASANSKSDEVSMAEMLKDESKTYFERAEKSMQLAGTVTSAEERSAALEDAVNNQQIALQKQQKALDLYKKNNPALVVKPTPASVLASNTKPANANENPANTSAQGNERAADAGNTTTTANSDALSIDAVNANYSSQLADANKITNELERENAKAEVLKNWSDAINSVIAKQKAEMAAASDPSVKADWANKIVAAQKLSEEKQTQASASQAQADALKQQQAVASTRPGDAGTTPSGDSTTPNNRTIPDNSTPNTTGTVASNDGQENVTDHNLKSAPANTAEDPATSSRPENTAATTPSTSNPATETTNDALSIEHVNAIYAPQLADANKITNGLERENAKAEVLKNWSDAINAMVVQQKAAMRSATDPSVKADLANKIVAAQQASEEKQTQASASLAQADALKQQQPGNAGNVGSSTDIAANNPSTATGDSNPESSNPTTAGSTTPDHTTRSTTAPVESTSSPATTATTTTTTTPATTSANTPTTNNNKPTTNTNSQFERTSAPAYSAAKPIPVNEKLPEGLVFKVQIGAFRNPISPETFAGMKPITAETTSQGVTRYTAGLFTQFAAADKVKAEIRGLGYKDAFVVAFLNGKRIPITEALKMSGENGAAATIAATSPESRTAPATSNDAGSSSSPAVTAAANAPQTPANTTNTEAPQAENVATVTGLFYTVQVGVYSQPITAAKLHNIQPLYTERTATGALRYNTGIYNSVARASEAKNVAVSMGIKDAFVTAYFKGKRISMAEAQTLEASGGSSVFTTAPGMNELPYGSEGRSQQAGGNRQEAVGNKQTAVGNTELTIDNRQDATDEPKPVINNTQSATQQPANDTQEPVAAQQTPANDQVSNPQLKNTVEQNNTMAVDPGVVYKVQIGAFKDEVPLEIANQFLKLAGKGIKNYKDENGLTIYTLGNFKTYDEASQLRTEVAAVVKDAFVVAYNDGKKISIDEARSLQTK